MNCLSFKTKFGWISAFEKKNKIVILKFGKHKNKSISKNLKKLRRLKGKSLKKLIDLEKRSLEK